MKKRLKVALSTFTCFAFLLSMLPEGVKAETTITSNETGVIDGYNYEYWKDYGYGTMTLNGDGKFSCAWNNVGYILFYSGKKLGATKNIQDYGSIIVDYQCKYYPNGDSCLAVYGWTQKPLVEYYIAESYARWKPPGCNEPKGTYAADSGIYEIYETTVNQQPSIEGTKTYKRYWGVRLQKRSSGSVRLQDHFNAWEAKGMKMGNLYDVAMVVEGYECSGVADMKSMNIFVGPPIVCPCISEKIANQTGVAVTERSAFTVLEAEEYNTLSSSIMRKINTDNGVSIGHIGDGDYLVFNKTNFGSGASSFKARVAYGGDSNSIIQLRLGSPTGTLIGSLSIPSTGGWDVYDELSTTISGVSGIQDLYLCFNGNIYIDSFTFSPSSSTEENTGGEPSINYGDLDLDGNISSLDLAVLRKHLLGVNPLVGQALASADVNADGNVDSIDFGFVRQYLLEMINRFPAQSVVNVTPTPTDTELDDGED